MDNSTTFGLRSAQRAARKGSRLALASRQVVGAFLATALLLGGMSVPSVIAEEEAVDVTPERIIADGTESVVLDVRSPKEFQAGHLANAVNINVNDAQFSERIGSLDPSKTYVVHCGANTSRGRAARAIEQLQAAGFTNLENLVGGYQGWVKAGGEVVVPQ